MKRCPLQRSYRPLFLAFSLALFLATVFFSPSFAYADGICKRVSGDTRYDTATSLVAESGGWDHSEIVVLASGVNYPDALSAASYAGYFDSPILLTDPDYLSSQAEQAIKRLSPESVIIVGGQNAVSDNVYNEALKLVSGGVWRISGNTRYDTSLQVLDTVSALYGHRLPDTVFIATGDNYADSLSISPYSYSTQCPVVLCDSASGLSSDAISAIAKEHFSKAILLGGSAAVPDSVSVQLNQAGIPSSNITRLSGETRYETSIEIAKFELSQGGSFGVGKLGFATGSNFADALAIGPCMGRLGAPLLLVDPGSSLVCSYITQFKGKTTSAFVAGGPNAVSQSDFDAIEAALTPNTEPEKPVKRFVDVPSSSNLVYNGSRQMAFVDTSDYTVRSGGAIDAGNYAAVLSLKDKSQCQWASTGSSDDISVQWSISPADISNARVSISPQTYTGSALTPSVKVEVDGRNLSSGSDYRVDYSDNVHAGTARAVVSGLSNYTGTASALFRIGPADLSDARVEVSDQRYSGSPLTPDPQVTLNGRYLSKDADYTVSYSKNTEIGTALITVNGIGDYSGKATGSFKISRGQASSRKVTIGEVTVTVYTYPDGYSYVDIPSGNVSINSCINKVRSIEVNGSSKDENANVDLWDNNGLTSQIWKFISISDGVYRVQNAYSGKVLGVADDDVYSNGANIVQQSWNDRDGQKWQAVLYNDKLMLVNSKSGAAIDCKGGSADCETNIQLWTKNDSNAQLFELRSEKIITKGTKSIYVDNIRVTQTADDTGNRYYDVPEGTYIIQSCAGSNQVLDLYWGNKDNGTNVETWQDNGGNGQKWKFVRYGNGIYKIFSVASDKCLEVAGQDSSVNGGNVQQWDYADGWSNKLWKLWLTKDNKLIFLNLASYRALNVSGGKAGNGVNVNVLDRDMSNAQAWTLKTTSKKIDPNEECRAMENEIWNAYCNYRRSNGLPVPTHDNSMDGCGRQSAQYCADRGRLEHNIKYSYDRYSDILQFATYRMNGQTALNNWAASGGHKAQLNCRTVTKAGVGVVYKNGTYYMSIVYDWSGTNVG